MYEIKKGMKERKKEHVTDSLQNLQNRTQRERKVERERKK